MNTRQNEYIEDQINSYKKEIEDHETLRDLYEEEDQKYVQQIIVDSYISFVSVLDRIIQLDDTGITEIQLLKKLQPR